MVLRLILSLSSRMASEVDIGRRQIVDALVVAQVIVVGDKGFDPNLEFARQIIVFQQDAVLERQMPALDPWAALPGHTSTYGMLAEY